MGLFSPPNINRLKDKHDIKGLLKALNYRKNIVLQAEAARVLGELQSLMAVEPLIKKLDSTNSSSVRITAVEALSMIGDIRATEPIAKLLMDNDDYIMYTAAGIGYPKVETCR